MDQPCHMDQSLGEYLHQNRSAPASFVDENHVENQSITETKIDAASRVNTPLSASVPSLSTTVSGESENSPFGVGVPVHYITQSRSSQAVGDQSWTYLHSSRVVNSPVPFIEEPQETTSTRILPPRIIRESPPADMTTLGVHFDPQFDPVARTSYTWPLFDMDMNEQFVNQDIASLDPFNISASASPYTKSLTSSPPPPLFSPEQRELKRQRDLARRDSKTQKRRERAMSNPYQSSQHTTPDLLPRVLANNFSSTMAQQSMTAQSSPTFSNTCYMPPMAPLSSTDSPDLYIAPFPLISNDFGIGPYLMPPYSSTLDQSIPAYTSRPHSLSSVSDQPYFYRGSPVSTQESQETVRVVHSRPKPQCWDHGCNGRQFSTFSNLLRHQREKSGVSSKPSCPKCGAEFTRTTARNGHMAHEKCKQRRNSNH